MSKLPRTSLTLAALAALATLTGCANQVGFTRPSELQSTVKSVAEQRQLAPAVTLPSARVEETPGAYIPLTVRKNSDTGWLKDKKVDISVGSQPVPLTEILRVLSKQGLNITSELPLDRFTYSGFDMKNVEAETALRIVLSASGLDYTADAGRELVTIRPIGSRTWYLNIGNRSTSYGSGGVAGSQSGSGSQGSQSSGAQSTMTNASGSSKISSTDNFWGSLKDELEARLNVMLPTPPTRTAAAPVTALAIPAVVPGVSVPGAGLPPSIPVPGMPGRAGAGNAQGAVPVASLLGVPATATVATTLSGSMNFVSQKVGSYSLNPETGAITVQAPHWVLNDLYTYMKRVQEMYNTDIVFQGELVMLSSDASRSE